MNLKSAIETLRTELRKFTTQKQAFADYKLADGTVIRVDGDLVAGAPVYVLTEDETLPAPDGEHTVEGVGVVKTEGGKITEVVVAEAPAPAQSCGPRSGNRSKPRRKHPKHQQAQGYPPKPCRKSLPSTLPLLSKN
jgi:hypothetical protein